MEENLSKEYDQKIERSLNEFRKQISIVTQNYSESVIEVKDLRSELQKYFSIIDRFQKQNREALERDRDQFEAHFETLRNEFYRFRNNLSNLDKQKRSLTLPLKRSGFDSIEALISDRNEWRLDGLLFDDV